MAVNFVKFQRGSQDAYGLLRDRNAVDPDTLYFLYDSANPDNGGDLYLGYTLIGGTSSSSSGVTSLRELSDVSLVGSLADGMILQYSSLRNKWINKSIKSAIEDSGASLGAAVTVETALAEGETINDVLTDIANPHEGDIAVIAGNPYVYDGSDWVSLTNSDVLDRLTTLESEIVTVKNTIQSVRSEIDQKIAAANHLTYKKLNDGQTLADIDTTASDIDRTIFLVPVTDGGANNNYYEYMYVNGQFEKIGSWATNLNGYVTETMLNSAVTNIQNQINGLSGTYVTLQKYNNEIGSLNPILQITEKNSTNISEEIVDIHSRLKWTAIPTT